MKNIVDDMEHYYVECQCDDASHLIRIVLDGEIFEDDNFYDERDSGIYIETQLSCYLPLWKRIWYAIKYIFNMDCKYGHWDCTLLKMEDIKKIDDIFRRVIKVKEIKEFEKNSQPISETENNNQKG